jgi:prepilin-type N-terminal cleavage/methylation domain-containing protein
MTPTDTDHRHKTPQSTGAERGFSLLEVAVVLFIITLLLGSILVPLSSQVEQKQISETQKTLDEIREALVGYAVANGNLPCPDTDADGTENVNAGTGLCSTITGNIASGRLPYTNLGLGSSDLWGNRYTYVINSVFAQRSPATPFSLSAAGTNVRVCTTQACTTTLSTTAVLAIISHGKNGAGAINFQTGAANPASASADEQDNYGTDADVVYRPQLSGGAAASEFDDIVVWLSRYTLFNRMVSAGMLP